MTEEPKGFKAELKAYKKAIEEGAPDFLWGYAAFSLVVGMLIIPGAERVQEMRAEYGGVGFFGQLFLDWTIIYAVYKFYKAATGSDRPPTLPGPHDPPATNF